MNTAKPTAPLAAKNCPLCGGPDGCVPADTGSFAQPCWCASVPFSPELLARVPVAARGCACICQACATTAPTKPLP